MEKVIYLSFAQGNKVDGALLAKNVSAVMIRGGQGIWLDETFKRNYDLCVANNIPFGIWWFCQPNMLAAPQVKAFLDLWNSLEVKPAVIAYDVEDIDYYEDILQPDGTIKRVWKKVFPPSRQYSHDNVLKWCKDVKAATNGKVGIYTRKFYFQDWTFETKEWYDFWMWIAAWYNYTGLVKPDLPWKWPDYKLHQYEGGGQGTPGVDPWQTCKEYFNGTHDELLEFFGTVEKETTMASLHVETTPQTSRAKVFTWRADQALKKEVNISDLGADAFILPMGGYDLWDQSHSHMPIYQTASFKGRFESVTASKYPVIGRFNLHAGRWGIEQFGADTIIAQSCTDTMTEAQKKESVRNNLVMPALLGSWCNGNFSMDALFAKTLKWLDIKAIELSMVETIGFKGAQVGDFWQTLSWNHTVQPLRWLMLRGYIPNIPIIMFTGPWFLDLYKNDLSITLANSKGWLWLHLGQWVLTSTATFATLKELLEFRPSASFMFTAVPDGYGDRVLLHEYSDQTQKCSQVVDVIGSPETVSLSLWQDTKEEMLKILGVPNVIPPVEPPIEPPINPDDMTISQLTVAVKDLLAWQSKIRGA